MLNPSQIKKDFPIFANYPDLVYLDNAATTHKPQIVIDAITEYYSKYNSNVHRGVHFLSDESTRVFEKSRATIAHFFGAQNEELILTRNTTESINGVAYGWGLNNLGPEDIILTTITEHHSNIVPWQEICKKTQAKLEFIALTKDGQLDLNDFAQKIKKWGSQIKVITLVHISNSLGTITPLDEIKSLLKNQNLTPRILLDGAQSAPHLKINFAKLGVDFYTFSGHKMLGPMGVGGLLVKKELLQTEEFQPFLFGGGMIDSVTVDGTKFHEDLSERFVAGTPDVASIYGLAKACEYLDSIGMDQIATHEQKLLAYALEKLSSIPQIQIVGPTNPQQRIGSVSFLYEGVHAHDVAQILDSTKVAVRSGHHCTMPLHQNFKWLATTRASFSVYNSLADIDRLVVGLAKVKEIFGK